MAHHSLRIPKIECLPETLRRVFGYEPREEQLEAIKTLSIDQEDLILIARTNFGKCFSRCQSFEVVYAS